MTRHYEKHQRDYTILATSLVMEEFFSPRFEGHYSNRTKPMYILVKDGVLYHYLDIPEKKERVENYLRKHERKEIREYVRGIDATLRKYRHFLTGGHSDILEALEELHRYMRLFVTIIILAAEAPLYGKLETITRRFLLSVRKRYDNVHKLGIDQQRRLLTRLERKKGLPLGTLDKLLHREFQEFLKSGILPPHLAERKKFFFAVHRHSGSRQLNRQEAIKTLRSLEADIKLDGTGEIKGQPAFRGKAKGPVRVIRLVLEAKDLKKGEILVTAMTDPRYVSAMKKAAAIITDEGGVTCHAAIVAREFKRPCVIGTKIATRILKTGDLVEVDADKGLVRIISNK